MSLRLINNRNQLQTLDSGKHVPADGSIEVEEDEVSDDDRKRLGDSGIITIIELPKVISPSEAETSQASTETASIPTADSASDARPPVEIQSSARKERSK